MPSLSHVEKLFFGESVDEHSEKVIDHILRKLLLHQPPKDSQVFDYSWSDKQFLSQLYDDKTFPQMVQKMYGTILPKCFKTTTSISQKITLTKLSDASEYDLMSWNQYSYLLNNLDQEKQKKTLFKDKEMFIWSFCVIIAIKIKFLEINTLITTKEGANAKTKAYKDRYFQFRQLQGLIQKFVLEMSEPSAANNLWPWHDNCVNDTSKDFDAMRKILHHNGEYILSNKSDINSISALKPISIKPFNYPNIRYIRKCAANLLLNEALTAKQLFDIHKSALKKSTHILDSTSPLQPTVSPGIPMYGQGSIPSLKLKLSESAFGEEEDNEPIREEYMQMMTSFGGVLDTIFGDTHHDAKIVALRNMLSDAIKHRKKPKKVRFDEKKEQKQQESKGFTQFYNYFTQIPPEFKIKRKQSLSPQVSNNFNKYDLLLLALGIEYGFDLHRIKKLLYIYKENVPWEFRQFFKVKIHVVIRMKYLCTLILSNSPKSYFNQTLITSNSTVFVDGGQLQQHLKYCHRHTHALCADADRTVAAQPYDNENDIKSSLELQGLKKSPKSLDVLSDKGATDIVVTPPIAEEPIRIQAKSRQSAGSYASALGHGQLSIHRKRSSLLLGEGDIYQALLLRIVASRDIQSELRDCIHFYEGYELTDDIVEYIIDKIRNKTDHRVLESLWTSLIIILSQLPLIDALRLLSKHWDGIRNKQISNVKFIEALVNTLIRCSSFPIATALFLSAYLEERAADDITRCDQWINIAKQCEKMAVVEVEKINSDHVLCLLLYAPTDIQLLSTLTLAIRYNRVKFLHHPYITGVLENIWSNGNPMMADPLIAGSLFTTDAGGLIQSVWSNPTNFVYSAFGIALVRCLLFTLFLVIVAYYGTYNECQNLHLRAENPGTVRVRVEEIVILSVVFSLIWGELMELTKDSSVYFSKVSNSFDAMGCAIWFCIIAMKIWSRICFKISHSVCFPENNATVNGIYYALWAIVMIYMFLKITIVFQFTALMGRFLKTVSLLIQTIFTFLITACVFFLGFVFCLYILANAGGERTGTSFDTIGGTTQFLYDSFLSLKGPSALDFTSDFENAYQRYTILTFVVIYQILAAVLLLNLLIAMMSDTYTGVFKQAVAETNFFKIEQTVACVRPFGRLIAGFAFFVLIFCSIQHGVTLLLQFLWYMCCGSRWLFDVNVFQTWRWIYADFWDLSVLCPCCMAFSCCKKSNSQSKPHSRDRSYHDYTKSELILSTQKPRRSHRPNDDVQSSKLQEIAPDKLADLIVDGDYAKGAIDSVSKQRKTCCFCCVKQRTKSQWLQQEIARYHSLTVERKQQRRETMKMTPTLIQTQILSKTKEKSNLLYVSESDDSSSSSSDEKTHLNKARESVQNVRFEDDKSYIFEEMLSKMKRYKTNDKRVCRREMQRNRRLNKVRKDFAKMKKKQKQESFVFRFKNWYNRWGFVDNETFCPNCFIGSPANSIYEYGTIEGFIGSVEKQFEYVIKRNDRMSLRRSLQDCILCQRCFFPLHMNKFHDERKTRFQIMVEITSTYFFYVLVWMPLQILILPFGLIGLLRRKTKEYGSAQYLLWQIEETKNFHDVHGQLLPDHTYNVDKCADSYQHKKKITFE